MKRVLVTGGTGFVGRAIIRELLKRGSQVTVLTRNPSKANLPRSVRVANWDPSKRGPWYEELGVVDAVIHLAGAPVAKRWSSGYRKTILSSRVDSTKHIVAAIGEAKQKPSLLLSASATGYYGASRTGEVDETAEPGSDFLAEVCTQWEAAAQAVSEHGVRNVQLRLGVVLGPDGGALDQLVMPMGAFVGGPIGKGDNHMSWVALDDVVGMAMMALDDDSLSGAINCTSPYYTTGKELAKTTASVLGRSALPVPMAAVRLMLGDAVDVVVGSQQVYPARAIDLGYEYHHARLVPALEASLMADA